MIKYVLIVYLFTHSGDYLWKDIYPVKNQEECIQMAQKVTRTLIDSGNPATFFCVPRKEYETNENLMSKYESTLNPIDEHDIEYHDNIEND